MCTIGKIGTKETILNLNFILFNSVKHMMQLSYQRKQL
jgi:hypothetical protein